MKHAFLILALSTFTLVAHSEELNEYIRAGQVKMSAKDCEELGVKVSIVAFSSDYNPSFMMLDLNNKKAVDFFDTTRKQIHEKISAYCKDDKSLKTIDDFQEQFHASCAPACDDNLEKIYKDSVWGASKEKKNADITCMSLCNQTSRGLELLKTGARYAAGKQSSAAGDCNGVVSNKGKNIDVKEFISVDKKNQRIRDAINAER